MCKGCDIRTAMLVRQSQDAEALAKKAEALAALDGSEVLAVLASEIRDLAASYAGPAERHGRPRTRAAREARPPAPIIEPNGQAAMRV